VILVDSNVLIDVIKGDPVFGEWSQRELLDARARDTVSINDIVYAELSIGYATVEDLEGFLEVIGIVLAPTPRAALFLAAKAFQRYRAAGGIRTGVLPDFFIGAHAQVMDSLLLTRDPRRYRSYFPNVSLIAPAAN
jgi:predicted nucleic acid-binding protein